MSDSVAASEDSEDAREKRAMKRQIKEKEMAYAARLREWEGREKKMVSPHPLLFDLCGVFSKIYLK